MDEDDIATYTIKTIDDPRALDKTVYLRPPENILTQRQLIEKWENLRGRKLEKCSIPAKDFLASMKGINQFLSEFCLSAPHLSLVLLLLLLPFFGKFEKLWTHLGFFHLCFIMFLVFLINITVWDRGNTDADMDHASQVGVGHFYHVFYEGCLTNFEAGKDGEEASELYPEVEYTRMESYLKRYV